MTNNLIADPLTWISQFESLDSALPALTDALAACTDDIPSINSCTWSALPSLNQTVVSFVGFVQDASYSNEIFPLRWSSVDGEVGLPGSGIFRNRLPPQVYSNPSSVTHYGDRQPVYVATVPNTFDPVHSDSAFPTANALKFPLGTATHQAVLAKFYTSLCPAAEIATLGSVVMIVGILELSDTSVPGLHVLKSTHLHAPLSDSPPTPNASARQCTIDALAHILQGDWLAAELFLLHVLNIPPPTTDTHYYPLTLIASDTVSSLESVFAPLSSLLDLPLVHLPLSLSTLNDHHFAPRSCMTEDQDDDDDAHLGILAGRLQLASGSVLIIDECALEEGKLSERGVTNLQTLNQVVTDHTLPYTFPYQTCSLPAKYASVLVTESFKPALVTRGVRVPWIPQPTTTGAAFLDTHACSSYLMSVQARPVQRHIESDVQLAIEKTYVQDRKSASANLYSGLDDLDRPSPIQLLWLVSLASNVSKSFGHSSVTMDHWEHARRLDSLRRERIMSILDPSSSSLQQPEPLR